MCSQRTARKRGYAAGRDNCYHAGDGAREVPRLLGHGKIADHAPCSQDEVRRQNQLRYPEAIESTEYPLDLKKRDLTKKQLHMYRS